MGGFAKTFSPIGMIKNEKIAHHVRKEARVLGLSPSTSSRSSAIDANVNSITQILLSKYKEYETYPADVFSLYVREAHKN